MIWYAVPNGEERRPSVGRKLRNMGVLPGVADIALVLLDGRAAFIELKGKKGRQAVEQMVFEQRCLSLGVPYALCRSLEEVEFTLFNWNALKDRHNFGRKDDELPLANGG